MVNDCLPKLPKVAVRERLTGGAIVRFVVPHQDGGAMEGDCEMGSLCDTWAGSWGWYGLTSFLVVVYASSIASLSALFYYLKGF